MRDEFVMGNVLRDEFVMKDHEFITIVPPVGVDPEDSAREIKVPFELFIPYMQLLYRALSIRLLLVMAKTNHGRLETALVSIFCFQAHCHMFILKRRGIGVSTRSLASLC